jgi:hypothetical protein
MSLEGYTIVTNEARPIDATRMPDVSRLIHEVNRTGRSQIVEAGGEAARLSPATLRHGRTDLTPAQREAQLRKAFGAWKGLVDAEQLKRDLDAARGSDSRLPELER